MTAKWQKQTLPFIDRILSRIIKTETCWIWTGRTNAGNYGVFAWDYGRKADGSRDSRIMAHRLVYELMVGYIPDGLLLDHLCRNHRCVNPAHLEVVTNGENVLRGQGFSAVNARKTHCVRGHEFSGDNLRIKPDGSRNCRLCNAEYLRRKRAVERNSVSVPK